MTQDPFGLGNRTPGDPRTLRIIPIYPPAVLRIPEMQEIRSPVSIEHTLTDCPRCGTTGWIGPKQLEAARAGRGIVRCVPCVFAEFDGQATNFQFVGLNPGIEDVPRRLR